MADTSPGAPVSRVALFGVVGALCAFFVFQGARAIGANSPTTDEPGHYRYGHRILRGVAARWDDSKMPISALNALPCYAIEKRGGAGDEGELSGPCDWTLSRIPTLICGLLLGFAILSWSKQLFGWSGALVSFALFALDPNLLAHSTLVTTDVWGALGILLSLRAFASWHRAPTLARAALLGGAVGLASISKYTAAYLPIIFIVALVLSRALRVAPRLPALTWGRHMTAALLIVLAVVNAGFLFDDSFTSLRDQNFESPQFRELRKLPVLSRVPLPVPRPFVEGLDRVFHRERHGGGSGNLYYLGELRSPGSEGFMTYFLVVGFLKTPLPSTAVILLAFALLVRRRSTWNFHVVVLLAAVLVFGLYFSLFFRAQIGLRHFLVALPPMIVLGGAAGPFLSASRMRITAAGAAFALSAISLVRHGDDPLSYFNELVKPTETWRVAADSNLEWGQTRSQIDAYLSEHRDVILAPARPFPGRILVGVNQLTGVVTRRRMEWLRASGLRPVGHVAYTHFLFIVSEEEAARLRRERGDRPFSPD